MSDDGQALLESLKGDGFSAIPLKSGDRVQLLTSSGGIISSDMVMVGKYKMAIFPTRRVVFYYEVEP